MRNAAVFLSLTLAIPAAAVSAGVVMEYEIKSAKDSTPMVGSLQVETDRLRMENAGMVVIYRADKDLVWMINGQDKSYTELTRAALEAMAKQMAEAMKALETMPPEMRAKMQGMMGGAADNEPETLQKLGKSETINGFPCEAYQVSKGAKVVRTAWVTPFKKFDVKASDFAVMTKMAEFWKKAGGPFAKNMDKTFLADYSDEEKPGTLPGVPIRTVSGDTTHEIKKVAHETIAADRFEVPAGFKKSEMRMGR